MNDLPDVLVDGKAAASHDFLVANGDVDRSGLTKLTRHCLDLLRPGGREHASLSLSATDLADNPANVLLEAHIEHAIRLIKYQVGDAVHVSVS